MSKEYFATFGGLHLEGFAIKVSPMKIAVTKNGYSENELRAELRKPPFNNNYCTTYPMEDYEAMAVRYAVVMYDLDILKDLK